MKALFIFFVLSNKIIFGSMDFSIFEKFQEKWTQEEMEEKLSQFLHIGDVDYISLTNEKLILYDRPLGEREKKVEFELRLIERSKKETTFSKQKNLEGVKIAIDPGHFGGQYAHLEDRYIDIPPSLEREHQIQFDEGTLCYLTAVYLKNLLEKEGAVVFLTREEIGNGAFGQNFFDWLKENPSLWSEEQSLKELFRTHYNRLDLRARAEKINAFSPDLSIVIHFNSHHVKEMDSSNHAVTGANYNLVFVPGAFCSNELKTQESRFEFLRLLVTDDFSRSVSLSKAILDEFGKQLDIPVISKASNARYLEKVCIKVDEGVYARNLALTRMIHSPLCYGETLVQNNVDECLNLSKKDFVIDNVRCSSRIKQVAEAYFEGIKHYLLEH